MIRLFTKRSSYLNSALVLVCALLALTISAGAQSRSASRMATEVDDVVFAISFSPDGSTLAIARGASDPGQRYGRIELWDTKTGTLRHAIKGFDGPVKSISFSPDGQTLVSASCEYRTGKFEANTLTLLTVAVGELKWWDAQTGELKHKLTLPREYSFSLQVTYSPNGKQLALIESFHERGYVPSNPRADPLGRGNAAQRVRPIVPLGFFESDLKLLDAQTGEVTFKLDNSRSETAVFSPDGALLAEEKGKDIRLWNVQTGREEHRLKDFKGEPNTFAFSPDGQSLAVAVTRYYHEDQGNIIKVIGSSEVQIFDVRTWKMALQLQNLGMVNSLAFEPGGKILLIGGLIHEQDDALPGVKLWDLQTGKSANFHTGGEDFSKAVDSLAISRNGGLLAFKSGPDVVQVLDSQTWKVKYSFDKNSDTDNQRPSSRFLLTLNRVTALGFSHDGNSLSGQIEGDGIKRWDPRTGEVKKHIADHEGANAIVEVSANGNKAAGVGDDGTIHLWDLTTGNQISLSEPGPTASALGLSTDGENLAIAYPNRIIILNTATRELTRSLDSRLTNMNRVTFSADGGMLASAGEDGAIATWDLASGQHLKTIASAGRVTALRFAPRHSILASATEDGSVSLWNLQTGALSLQLKKHSGAVNAIAFSPDGNLMATGGDDRTVIIWESATGKARRTLKGQDLTVTSLAFSPDGTLLASGGGNASVVLWDVRSGELNRVLK
jgi:WD40 repeat protein